MATLRKTALTFVVLFSFLIGLSGCSSPVPTGDRIKSVSWVNPRPITLQNVEALLCDTKKPVILDKLPGYSEKAVAVDIALYENCNVRTKANLAGQDLPLGTGTIEAPSRKSSTGEYNLRIQLRQATEGAAIKVTLEPLSLMQQRLSSAAKGS